MDKSILQNVYEQSEFDIYEKCKREAEIEILNKYKNQQIIEENPQYIDPIKNNLVDTTHWKNSTEIKYDRYGNPIKMDNRKMFIGLESQNDVFFLN